MSDSKKKLKIKQSGIMNIRGKEVATYPAMIDYAHQCGMQSLEVAVLQFPHESNDMRAICGARLVTTTGEVFADIGDANPDNVPKGCVDSFVRIASTRAKSRVISDAFNIRNALETGQENDSEPILLTAVQDADNVYGLPEAQSQDKNSLQGGGNKPISEGQVSAIHKCAAKRGLDPVKVARDMYGKSIDELVGWEADQCIKSFRNR
ncbi:hypothetical protein SAMN05421830_1303 [Desulfomicrobium norvegicum]|uniref:Uncharacterized protein n=1 Tax=Desulfomicrobium norvegicum (strain DSM 1741 / NCIMB 8310) TaxID=52561 RepID=A0A8G2C6D0_DESNO|nr:hypothetical protein [Desulfomicrobium norvegicum]SFM24859.1 hypothetical protein SAMN05421830_1303 [Desulfomicrobium norvegicum]